MVAEKRLFYASVFRTERPELLSGKTTGFHTINVLSADHPIGQPVERINE